MKNNAYGTGSQFIRNDNVINLDINDILKSRKSKSNFRVQEGDKIMIANKPDMILVVGEINVPGYYKFIKNSRVNDALRVAGGLTNNAEKKKFL